MAPGDGLTDKNLLLGFAEEAPDSERWGVYAIWFPSATRTVEDLVNNFRFVLPQLKEAYARVRK